VKSETMKYTDFSWIYSNLLVDYCQ